jgi:hypothetical protein
VQVLLERGAHVDSTGEFKGVKDTSSLMLASSEGHLEVAKILLGAGADVNYALQHGQTALMVAAYEGRVGVVRLLLERGADATRSACGMTAMGLALAKKHAAVVSVFEGRNLYDYYVSSGKMDDEEAIEGCDKGKKCCRDGLIMAGESAVVCEGCEIVVHYECAGRVRPPKDGKWTCRACTAKLKAKELAQLEASGDTDYDESEPEEDDDDADEVVQQPKKRAAPRARNAPRKARPPKKGKAPFYPSSEPAPKKGKKLTVRQRPNSQILESRALLAKALGLDARSDLALACLGENDPRWDGTRPLWVAHVPLRIGYPEGTYDTSVGRSLFSKRAKPSAKGVYTIEKIIYEPSIKGKHTKKTGEKVYYRKVEESDIPAIQAKFDDLVF